MFGARILTAAGVLFFTLSASSRAAARKTLDMRLPGPRARNSYRQTSTDGKTAKHGFSPAANPGFVIACRHEKNPCGGGAAALRAGHRRAGASGLHVSQDRRSGAHRT